MTEIPTTKDGKYQLVFPYDWTMHSPRVRSPVCGRLGYELLDSIDKNPDLFKKLHEEFGSIFRYDFANDPANIFAGITIPVVGSLDLESAVKIEDRFVISELRHKPPYIPFNRYKNNNGKSVLRGCFDSDSVENSLFAAYFDPERVQTSNEELKEMAKAWEMGSSDPSIGYSAPNYNLEIVLNPEWRRLMKKVCTLQCQGTKVFAEDKIKQDLWPPLTIFDDEKRINIMIAKDARIKVYEAVAGLCDEYLKEMKDLH